MADITADTGRIRDCSNSLWQIYNAFTNHADPLDGYDPSVMGAKSLVNVFADFAHNWKIHRKGLAEKIQVLGQALESAADDYEQADTALADALRKADAQAAHSGGH